MIKTGAGLVAGGSFCPASLELSREKQMDHLNIAVILPAYNEEVYIGSVVLLARRYADRIIVVDNGNWAGQPRLPQSQGQGNCSLS